MKKYYLVQNAVTGLYLAAMSHTEWVTVTNNPGAWPDEESAANWIENMVGKFFIVPIWTKYK